MKDISKPALDEFRSDTVGVPLSCVGIDLMPICRAPLGEVVRINVHTDNPNPETFLAFAKALSGGEPFLVGPMEFITILKHSSQPIVGFRPKPSHSGDLNLHKHAPEND